MQEKQVALSFKDFNASKEKLKKYGKIYDHYTYFIYLNTWLPFVKQIYTQEYTSVAFEGGG